MSKKALNLARILVLFALAAFLLLFLIFVRPSTKNEGAIFIESPTVQFSRFKSVLAQRDALSCKLNEVMRDLQRLQCNFTSKTEKESATTETSKISATGGWCNEAVDSGHMTDLKIVPALRELLQNKSVASFGEGRGEYRFLLKNFTKCFDAFDGAPFIEPKTHGVVRYLDLSVPQFGLPVYDWVLSVEVAEHIPVEFESIYLDNLVRHAREGVILSWAVPGQVGFFHVNPRPADYVMPNMEKLCLLYDEQSSLRLRKSAKFWWLRENLNVYSRDHRRESCWLEELAA